MEIDASQLHRAEHEANLVVEARDLVQRYHDLAAIPDALLDNESHDLALRVQHKAADGADALAVAVDDVGTESNEHHRRLLLASRAGAR